MHRLIASYHGTPLTTSHLAPSELVVDSPSPNAIAI